MAYFIETKGELNLKEIGRICLDSLRDVFNDQKRSFSPVYLSPQYTGSLEDNDFYLIGRFNSNFDKLGIPRNVGSVFARRPDSVHRTKNKKLKFLLQANDVLPDWHVYFEGVHLDENTERELGVELSWVHNVKEVWHYWGNERNIELEAMKWLNGLPNFSRRLPNLRA
ncbi:MAG: hypothetical protein PHD31_02905 [Candidatus Pacebacteria bacterium]|nr:hypothetical protein [Candidatus Paceibacterota bacterium]